MSVHCQSRVVLAQDLPGIRAAGRQRSHQQRNPLVSWQSHIFLHVGLRNQGSAFPYLALNVLDLQGWSSVPMMPGYVWLCLQGQDSQWGMCAFKKELTCDMVNPVVVATGMSCRVKWYWVLF